MGKFWQTLGDGALMGLMGPLFAGKNLARIEGRNSADKRSDFANKQLAEAKALTPSPITYSTPSAIDEYSKLMESTYRGGLPGERVIADNMGASVAGSVNDVNRVADTSAGALGAVSGLYGKYMTSLQDLGVKNAQAKITNENNFITNNANAALTRADYTDKAWEYNVNMPYQRALNKSEALERTGTQNLFAADDMATASRVDYANAISNQLSQWMQMIPYIGFGTGNAGGYNPSIGANGVETSPTSPIFR